LMPPRPSVCSSPWRIGIVSSLYNPTWVEGLASHFEAELRAISPNAQFVSYQVPGSFELPLAVELLASSGKVDAIAAFGVLLDGETAHATLVAQAITQALLHASLQHRIPVLHEVLLVKNAQQAEARCLGTELNRGVEAARAAARMLRTVASLKLSRE
ncbi:MAG: 6,7-dimethyl-8-ribityllumazine synthase, partial [Verrucomicrobiota bacterium]